MAFTQADLDTVNAALKAGTLTVEVEGRKVTYRSLSELLKIRDLIRADIATAPKETRTLAAFRRG